MKYKDRFIIDNVYIEYDESLEKLIGREVYYKIDHHMTFWISDDSFECARRRAVLDMSEIRNNVINNIFID